ncbi:hypothetical protein [Synechocystis sp. LKSZ1]|uniref:slr1658 superfamily regulator n=1 Tax=Synechocystis sp. LKSZ1 TaxID=3144951 RepID=UPI00336BD6D2
MSASPSPAPASAEIFGEFLDPVPLCHDFLTLNFTLSDQSRMQRWRNYGLSADFLGDYFSSFFPGKSVDSQELSEQATVKASVSFIANELLENAVKYGDQSVTLPISITLRLYEEAIIFEASNPIDEGAAQKYQAFIRQLIESDPAQLYFEQLEKTAMGAGESHIGLLTMIYDYEARFGWRFTPVVDQPNRLWVSVMVHLAI